MPSKAMALEWLKSEVAKGRGGEKCHVVDVEREQEARIKNEKRKMKFVLNTDDPDLCSEFEREKNRIFKHVQNKTLMLELMIRAWKEALSDQELDKIMAQLEMEDEQTHSAT